MTPTPAPQTTGLRAWPLLLAQQVGWFLCVLGAGSIWGRVGVAYMVLLVVVHIACADDRRRELRVVVLSSLLGIAGDSALVVTGLMQFSPTLQWGPFPTPLWFWALWLGFGATLSSTWMPLFRRSRGTVALVGAVIGPAAYLGGTHLLDMALGPPLGVALVAVGAWWALAMVLWQAVVVPRQRNADVISSSRSHSR